LPTGHRNSVAATTFQNSTDTTRCHKSVSNNHNNNNNNSISNNSQQNGFKHQPYQAASSLDDSYSASNRLFSGILSGQANAAAAPWLSFYDECGGNISNSIAANDSIVDKYPNLSLDNNHFNNDMKIQNNINNNMNSQNNSNYIVNDCLVDKTGKFLKFSLSRFVKIYFLLKE
jgi:hypothetical protein